MSTEHDVAKWYTRARRFPRLVGKFPDGTQIPFGPFTLTQVIGGAGVFFVAVQTMDIWGQFGFVANVLILISVLIATVFGLGMLPKGAASPATALTGLIHAFSRPTSGTIAGQPIKIRPPHRSTRRIVVHHPTAHPQPPSRIQASAVPPPTADAPPTTNPPTAATTAPTTTPAPLTAVQQLLAGAPRKDHP